MSVMPFGKYKGTPLATLPSHYIQWALEQTFITEPLRSQLEHARDNDSLRPQLVAVRNGIAETTCPPALQGYIRSIVLEGYKVGLEKLVGQDTKLDALRRARKFLEEHLGL